MSSYLDRDHAGKILSEIMKTLILEKPIVFALPRGGVPIAARVAESLKCALEVLIVKKIGAPFQNELTIGVVAENEEPLWNEDLLEVLQISKFNMDSLVKKRRNEMQFQRKLWEKEIAKDAYDKTAILVDDGIATGFINEAAIQALKKQFPKKIIVVTPVGFRTAISKIKSLVDEVICPLTPYYFYSVKQWYDDFKYIDDQEIRRLLQKGEFMGSCEVCGNDYEKTFKVIIGNHNYEFDCFECAIHRLAPTCDHCGCRIIGQGIEYEGGIYCGHHCQRSVERSIFPHLFAEIVE